MYIKRGMRCNIINIVSIYPDLLSIIYVDSTNK
jgi:hypothetical protein